MSSRAAILAIGNELLDGRVLDTNSHYLSRKLDALGVEVSRISLCRDDRAEITSAVKDIAKAVDFIICCGGLGPTTDDLTREALADLAGVGLRFDEAVCAALEARYARRGIQMDASNKQQAYFPETAIILPNAFGTASGFRLDWNGCKIFVLPGVPSELTGMYAEVVEAQIIAAGHARPRSIAAMRIFGRPEAKLNSIISALSLDPRIFVSYRADFPEVHVQLSASSEVDVTGAAECVLAAIGPEYVVSTDSAVDMPFVIHELMRANKKTLAVAESCTGGLTGMLLTEAPGASDVFVGGIQCYSNEVKRDHVGVKAETMVRYGAVSAETAYELAAGIRAKFRADVGVSVTGIAGPGGGTEQKPVGTFFIGISAEKTNSAYKHFLPASRSFVRRYSAFMALDTVRRVMLDAMPLGEVKPQ